MIRVLLLSFALLGTSLAGPAAADRGQLLALVSQELPGFIPGVDANSLSTHQLAVIYQIMHNSEPRSEQRAHIRSVLGGQYSLRGWLFN